MSARPPLWSEVDDATLRLLWAEGISTAEIGRRMGKTKGAVCGRAGRINCPTRVNHLTKHHVLVRKAAVKKPRPELALAMPPLRSPARVKPVGKRNCQFPLWGMGRATHIYCDAPAVKSYCPSHTRLCYAPRAVVAVAVAA